MTNAGNDLGQNSVEQTTFFFKVRMPKVCEKKTSVILQSLKYSVLKIPAEIIFEVPLPQNQNIVSSMYTQQCVLVIHKSLLMSYQCILLIL